MEQEGIGRPSTYASIISTIIDRGYVNKSANALVPSFTAMIVSKLLNHHLPTYVDLGFTTKMENYLDDIAGGELNSEQFLKDVYFGDQGLLQQVEKQEKIIDSDQARQIQFEILPHLTFHVGRYGAYVCRTEKGEQQCASLPDIQAPADVKTEDCHKLIDQKIKGGAALGRDPETDEPVYILTGRYGAYVQRGDSTDKKAKPKRTSIPPGLIPEDLTLDQALFLLSLPRPLGQHPEINKEVRLGIGRFGPYVVCDGDFRSIPKSQNFFEMDFEKAMGLLLQPKKSRRSSKTLKELGRHPETDEPMGLLGRSLWTLY